MNHRLLWVLVLGVSMVLAVACGRKQVTQQDKDAATAFYQLAVNAFQNGKLPDAMAQLEEASKYNPDDVNVHHLYGIIFLGKSNGPKGGSTLASDWLVKAETHLKRALEIEPKMTDARITLAAVYMERQSWNLALEQLKEAENDLKYPAKTFIFDNMGWCYHMLGQEEQAVLALKMSVAENPKNCHAWYNLGRVYRDQGQWPQAADSFASAVETEGCGGFLIGWKERGLAALKAKENETAATAFQRCVEVAEKTKTFEEKRACKRYLELMK